MVIISFSTLEHEGRINTGLFELTQSVFTGIERHKISTCSLFKLNFNIKNG